MISRNKAELQNEEKHGKMKKIEVAILQLHRCYGLIQKLSNATLFNINILKPPYTDVRVRIRGLQYDVQKLCVTKFLNKYYTCVPQDSFSHNFF